MGTTLLTGADSDLGRALADHLAGPALRPTARSAASAGVAACALDADEATDALVAGVEQIVHVEPALVTDEEDAEDWLDACTRTTFNLLVAAEAAGVSHFILISRLNVFITLPSDLAVIKPDYRPRPSTAPSSLGPHVAEFVARQFAFSSGPSGGTYESSGPFSFGDGGKMRVTVLRIGDTAQPGRFTSSEAEICEGVAAALAQPEEQHKAYTVVHCGEQVPGWTAPAAPAAAPAATAGALPTTATLLGSNGMMGPPVAAALAEAGMSLLLTDLDPSSPLRDVSQRQRDEEFGADAAHQQTLFALPDTAAVEKRRVDVASEADVSAAVSASGVVVFCAVVREHRELAFHVNVRGTFNAIRAAVAAGHDRFVNSGPVDAVVGHGMAWGYQGAAGGMAEPSGATPPWPGVGLYSITKGIGAEICRIYSENHPITHMMCIFGGVNNPTAPEDGTAPGGAGDMTTTMRDCGNLLRCCVQADLTRLPSRHEVFFGKAPVPSDVHGYGKAAALLGYEPLDTLASFFAKL